MTERFDIFDESLRHIGVKAREDVHRDGDWHQVFHCWVVGRGADGEAFVILQKRSDDKDMYPGKIDVSAAGHLEAGESVEDGIRELREELGLSVAFSSLIPLGCRLSVTRDNGLFDCQICHVFLYQNDMSLPTYDYQREEIAGLLKLPIEVGIRLLSGELDQVRVEAIGLNADQIDICADDFVWSIDNYTLKALILARRYFAGERHLLI